MWQSISSILTLLLPTILRVIDYIIGKKANNDNLKQEFLKFIQAIENDAPVKLRNKYSKQINSIRDELKLNEFDKNDLVDKANNYKKLYDELTIKYEDLLKLHNERAVSNGRRRKNKGIN